MGTRMYVGNVNDNKEDDICCFKFYGYTKDTPVPESYKFLQRKINRKAITDNGDLWYLEEFHNFYYCYYTNEYILNSEDFKEFIILYIEDYINRMDIGENNMWHVSKENIDELKRKIEKIYYSKDDKRIYWE